ncbi:ABC transporter permease [Sporosarcina oncorhynchi]|uniref:Transport permease protein n=1 Tax=Sporosarcina oncorhynchi TaxID=3056444 RepID=A0ABZ0L313_9BACL|nr:ABC transporter permease [Sporosarcina sp. T2O-4]WOV86850.1 ABC transporter permease [Sporosarcina sp. T2O-4]
MLLFVKRNMLIYARDKSAVFFSLLSVLILIGLYVFFLGDLIAGGLPDFPAKNWLLLSWIIAGVLSVTSVTTTLGAFGIMVEDKANQAYKDFDVAPIKRSTLLGGYIISSLSIGFFICVVALLLSNIMLFISGEPMMALLTIFKATGIILLSVLTAASMIALLVTFFKTSNAFAAISTVVGTLLGFLAGIYIPIGNLPSYLQGIIKVFPLSHPAALLRQTLMEAPLEKAFAGAPADMQTGFEKTMGVFFELNGNTVPPLYSVLYLIGITILFFSLTVWVMRLKKEVV